MKKIRGQLLGVFVFGCSAFAQSASVHVDDDNTTGVEDGSTQHPFTALQSALAQAADGDEIRRMAAG